MSRPRRPNFLVIVTDEERYPVPEETEELKKWRQEHLIARRWLEESGTTFHNHYTAATACTPSRASLFTGQYPSLHGVSETYGLAKSASDPRIQWLEPHTVPTMGNVFQAAGYETVYKGKWHISKADILREDGEELETVDEGGKRIPQAEQVYLREQPLREFGFNDWIGPEPHGVKIENGGINRDPSFSEQVGEFFEQRQQRVSGGEELPPFLMVASLVNPHDIALYPQFKSLGMEVGDATVPSIPPGPSDDEDLSTKPSTQSKYVSAFENVFCPPEVHRMLFADREDMRRMYYYLHKVVDQDLRHIYQKLRETSFFEDTIIILTADHGDMLGSHGNILQKWMVAYQEAIHIPLVISAPFLPVRHVDFVTSAVDLLPTMMGLAGLDQTEMQARLAASHSEVHPLVGNDFSKVLLCEEELESQSENVAYFMTQDEVTKGNSQVSIRGGLHYDAVDGATSIEAIVCFLDNHRTGERELWKYVRYHDDKSKWSHPFKKDVRVVRQGPLKGRVLVRTNPHPEEFELYNLSRDPSELHNLVHPTELEIISSDERQEVIRAALTMAGKLSKVGPQRRLQPRRPSPPKVIPPHSLVFESKL